MAESDVMGEIEKLANEERWLREKQGHGDISDAEREHLQSIKVQVNQYSDRLRRRRAKHGRPP